MKKVKLNTKDVHIHSDFSPQIDETFIELVKKALKGEIPVYYAAVPLAICVPFDLEYDPNDIPIAELREAINNLINHYVRDGKNNKFHHMIVYPKGRWFIVSDHYPEFFAAVENNPSYVPCGIMGDFNSDFVEIIEGPLDLDYVKKMFGVSDELEK